MTQKVRIGVVSPTHVAFPTIADAFARIWPEAEPIRVLDDSLYADFIHGDFTVDERMPDEAFGRVAALLRYSRDTRADGIIFCGSVFGRLVEAGRADIGVPVLTSYEGMIEEGFAAGNRIGIVATTAGTIACLEGDIERYAKARGLDYTVTSKVAEGAFQAKLDGDDDAHDDLVVAAAATLTDIDCLMLGQFSMGLVPAKIAPVDGRPVLTAPHAAVRKMKSLFAG
jgi:Asp/Glu/hydantoin racemase